MAIEIPKLITPPVRLSYAHKLITGEEKINPKTGEKYREYGCAMLFPKDPAATYARLGLPAVLATQYADRMKTLETGVRLKAVEFFGGADKIPKGVRTKDLGKSSGWPFRDQAQKEGDGYEDGALFLSSVSSRRKPRIVGRNPSVDIDPDKVYSGVWAICSLNVYGFKTDGNTGISFGLNNVQIVADDERLGGGGSSAEDDFADSASAFGGSVDLSDLGIG